MAVFLVLAAQETDDRPVIVGQGNALLGGDGLHGLIAQIGFQQVAVVVGVLLHAIDGVRH